MSGTEKEETNPGKKTPFPPSVEGSGAVKSSGEVGRKSGEALPDPVPRATGKDGGLQGSLDAGGFQHNMKHFEGLYGQASGTDDDLKRSIEATEKEVPPSYSLAVYNPYSTLEQSQLFMFVSYSYISR